MKAPWVDTVTRDGVTAWRTWSADPDPDTDPYAYVVDQRCVQCSTQVTDDDRGPLYDSETDDGTAHVCPTETESSAGAATPSRPV